MLDLETVRRMSARTGFIGRFVHGLLGLGTLLLLSAASAGEEKALVAGLAIGFPPYQYQDANGQPAGIDYEVARRVFSRLELKVSFHQAPWNDLLGAMRFSNGPDLLIGTEINAERRKFFAFSKPYYSRHIAIFVLAQGPIREMEDLRGKFVASDRQSFVERDLNRDRERLRLMPTVSKEESFRKLMRNEVVAVIAPLEVGYALAKSLRLPVRTIGKDDPGSPVAFAVRKENAALLPAINTALEALKASGEIERIFAAYR